MRASVGLDVGTSNIKGVLLAEGRVLACRTAPTELLRPARDRVGFSSRRSWELVASVIRGLVAAAPPGTEITGIALSGATGNGLLLDAAGEPLADAISWMDTRSVSDPGVDVPGMSSDDIHRVSGWPYFRTFPLAQFAWLRDHRPDLFGRAALCCMNMTYLNFRLCGRFGMDHSTATTFYLQDQVTRSWHRPYLAWLGITGDRLPPLLPSGSVLGRIVPAAARETGLPVGAAVVLGSFDHPSAALDCQVLEPGELLFSCGTSWVGFYPLPSREAGLRAGLLVDPFLTAEGGPWAGMCALTGVGEEIRAFVDQAFGHEPAGPRRFALFDEAAAAGGPCRALVDRVCGEMRRRLDGLAAGGLVVRRAVMVGGPSKSPVWRAALREATGLAVECPPEGTFAGAVGAARLAAGAP